MTRARELANLGNNTTDLEAINTVYDAGGLTGRNLIINGAMQVAQRGTSVSVSNGAGYKTVDRWHYTYGDSTAGEFSTWTMSQDTDAPEGFASSTKFICTTAASAPSARTSTLIQQRIEGQNLQHLKYGLSSANKLTASFWVKSNNTGTIGVTLLQTGNTRLYVESVSINSADTWEYKTITFDGDTANSLANDNSEELAIRFAWEYNTDRIGGSASWGASGTPDGQSYLAPTGTSARTTSLNDTFYITGVQLEVGETATPFEHRSFAQELTLCERYYRQSGAYGSVPSGVGGFVAVQGMNTTSAQKALTKDWSTPMRTTPTITVLDSSGTVGKWNSINTGGGWTNNLNYTAVADQNAGGFKVYVNSSGGYGYGMHYRADAEL